jgi:hypothetical protein
MWAIIKDGEIDQIIDGNKGVNINDVQHPKSIFKIWSNEELLAIGIVPYVTEDSGIDQFKYQSGSTTTISDDGSKVVNVINYTDHKLDYLKTLWKTKTNTDANFSLHPTDWYIIKTTETGIATPSDITTYRSSVRTAANKIVVDACSTLDNLKALFVVPVDSNGKVTGNAPIYDWPD